nr:ribonuclease H-like domain-containing protein [Tanacetum cinerariifolium]
MPHKPDLVFHDAFTVSETVLTVINVEPSLTKPTKDMSQSNKPSAPIIEDWVSDSEDESEDGSKACMEPCNGVNHQNSARMTHPHSKKHVVPIAVLTRSRLILLHAVRPVTTDVPLTNVNHQRPAKHVVNKPYSPIKRPINHRPSPKTSNFHPKVNTVKAKQEINGGYVAFSGNPKGGKITGKGKIKTGKLDFNDVYFVKELKFNLFSVSQMCDKKNSVLFTDTDCVVLSFDFKLPGENHVLLRVPRETNMYNNEVAERKNRTLIETARTMLANLLLPILFWAEAVNTACYVQNRVLVTKPHNKIPYELLLNRTPGIQANLDADADAVFDDKENESEVYVSISNSAKPKKHDEKAKREAKGKNLVDLSTRVIYLSDEFEEFSVNSTNRVNAASTPITAIGPNSTNSTNHFNAAGPSDNVKTLFISVAAKKQRIDEATEELKTHLQIVANDDDDVYTEATPLASNVHVVDYQIHH